MLASGKLTGAYYYPGWKSDPNHPWGPPWVNSWWWLSSYPERTPLIGAYDEGAQSVMDTSIRDAIKGGLDYFVFNWYYNSVKKAPEGAHAFNNFMVSPVDGMQAAIGFEPHTSVPPIATIQDWYDILEHWATAFANKKYLRFNGRPVVFNIKLEHTHTALTKRSDTLLGTTGLTHKELLDSARDRTGENIYFVACGAALPYWINTARFAGYDAYTAYNYSNTWTSRDPGVAGPVATSYAELHAVYVAEWNYLVNNLNMDLILPTTAGFNSLPWGGSGRPGIATLAEFEAHLVAVKSFIDANPKVRSSVLYAWNEWGEGGFVQPCRQYGRMKLNITRRVLK